MSEKLLIVLGVTTLCMLSPGPDMVLVMRNTLTGDRRRGGLTALGVLAGNLCHIGYCAVGLALLISRSPVVYNVLRIAGALYLVYLGIQGLRNANSGPPDPIASTDTRRDAFIDLTRRFEQTWYGSRAADGPGLLSHLEAFGCVPSKLAI